VRQAAGLCDVVLALSLEEAIRYGDNAPAALAGGDEFVRFAQCGCGTMRM
jgi:hypothetical protein